MGLHEFKSCAWYIPEKSGIKLRIKFFIQVPLPDVDFLSSGAGFGGNVLADVGGAVLEDHETLVSALP